MNNDRLEPLLFIFSAPAACGKSTVCRRMIQGDSTLRLSISTTTRNPRKGEEDGVDYYFVSEEEFLKRIKEGSFLEYASFGGHHYGTEMRNLEESQRAGADLLFDIDVQGARELKRRFGKRAIVTFVFVPSFEVLVNRFRQRGTDDEARIEERLQIAQEEIRELRKPGFSDYLLINDVLDEAVSRALSIVCAERMRLVHKSQESFDQLFSR